MAPSSENAREMALPIPLPPPVIIATLSFNLSNPRFITLPFLLSGRLYDNPYRFQAVKETIRPPDGNMATLYGCRIFSITPRFWLQPRPVRIFGCHGENLGMIESRQVPMVMKQGVAHPPACCPDVTRAMHPVGIGFRGWRRADMKMDIASMGMLDYSPIDKTGALMCSDDRLWMNATVYFGKVVDTFA